jgi:hypothetical protein
MTFRTLAVTALLVGLALPANAGQSPAGQTVPATGAIATATPGVDIARLPVNVGRIGRQLRQTEMREVRSGLKLTYTIQVFGEAPPIKLLTPLDNLLTGDVPRSSPTHADMIRMMTPREFSPGVTLGSFPRRK